MPEPDAATAWLLFVEPIEVVDRSAVDVDSVVAVAPVCEASLRAVCEDGDASESAGRVVPGVEDVDLPMSVSDEPGVEEEPLVVPEVDDAPAFDVPLVSEVDDEGWAVDLSVVGLDEVDGS